MSIGKHWPNVFTLHWPIIWYQTLGQRIFDYRANVRLQALAQCFFPTLIMQLTNASINWPNVAYCTVWQAYVYPHVRSQFNESKLQSADLMTAQNDKTILLSIKL